MRTAESTPGRRSACPTISEHRDSPLSGVVEIPEETVRALFIDPCFAWSVFIPKSYKLAAAQKVRLRAMWHVPRTEDSSSVGTGKSMLAAGYASLRAALLPDQKIGVYFPNFEVGKAEFWEPLEGMFRESRILGGQVDATKSNKGISHGTSAHILWLKNKSSIRLLPGNFINDSRSQAGGNFNTIIVDDWLRCEEMGEGLDKQLLDRARRPCFNMHHPIWGNHVKLLGHAEEPEHKGYRRHRAWARQIADGDVDMVQISFNSMDIDEMELPIHVEAKRRKKEMETSAWLRQHAGIWKRGGSNFYAHEVTERCRRKGIWPVGAHESAIGKPVDGGASAKVLREWWTAGKDTAKGEGERSDFAATACLRLRELDGLAGATLLRGGRFFRLDFPFAYVPKKPEGKKGWSGRQLSGLLYWIDERLGGLARVVADPSGGGSWVYSDVRSATQTIGGKTVAVTPFVRPDDPDALAGRAVYQYFARVSPIKELVEPHYLKGDDGLLDAFHRKLRAALERQEILLPWDMNGRSARELSARTDTEREIYRHIERTLSELGQVRRMMRRRGNTAEPMVSRNGYYLFEAKGKKDCAYALLYAFAAMLWLLDDLTEAEQDDDLVP